MAEFVSAKSHARLKKKLAKANARIVRQEDRIDVLLQKVAKYYNEVGHLKSALARAMAKDTEGGWAQIAERQRIYIKSLEERLAGTWDPKVTHQAGWHN